MLFIIRVCFLLLPCVITSCPARPVVEGGGGIVASVLAPSVVVRSPGQVCFGGLTSFLSCDQAPGLFSVVVLSLAWNVTRLYRALLLPRQQILRAHPARFGVCLEQKRKLE